ncbi:MAG: NADPH-dependent 7-cyano-7-deazaguanine reductase QueF [Gammaproteobacteria bacterium]|nr:NADPH-dependent 7-cyano-7-deazaguanine reductase QueF [Gammaproteobacteria bacterium]
MDHHTSPEKSELGKKAQYDSHYDASILFPISRKTRRDEIGVSDHLPFYGFDVWNHFEVSWLNEKGKPIVALGEIIYSCDSKNIIESKSMKLYFNSFNDTKFSDAEKVQAIIQKDLNARLNGSFVLVRITPLSILKNEKLLARLEGIYLDELDINCFVYHTDTSSLKTEKEHVEETLYSDLLKSNCLVTNQPDWCSVQITYKGKKINREGLLQYIVSFRNDNEFHEQCIEKIFVHIMQYCQPDELTVYGRSTRRGGIDINSYRSTNPVNVAEIKNTRLCRQ